VKKIALSLLLAGTLLANQLIAQNPLPLFKETPHFSVHCMANDQDAADKILAKAEQNFAQLTQLFNHTYSTKITLNVFPSIQAFHAFLGFEVTPNGQSSAPAWLINSNDPTDHSFSTVALTNPGTYHTADSILRFNISGMTDLFIKDAYKNTIPWWLVMGVGLWITKYVNYQTRLETLAKNHDQIPTLSQLNTVNAIEFDKHHGFACSYSLVEFINTTWGWDKVVALLANYAEIKNVLGIDEETLRTQWINYLDQKYLKAA